MFFGIRKNKVFNYQDKLFNYLLYNYIFVINFGSGVNLLFNYKNFC